MAPDSHDVEIPRLIPEVGSFVERGVLRRFVDPTGETYRASSQSAAVSRFLSGNEDLISTSAVELAEPEDSVGAATLVRRIQQQVNGLPLLGSELRVVADSDRKAVTEAVNRLDYDVAGAPAVSSAVAFEQLTADIVGLFDGEFATATIHSWTLCYLRYLERPANLSGKTGDDPPAWLTAGRQPDKRLHLVYDVIVITSGPVDEFRVVMDAVAGHLLFIERLSVSVTAKLKAYYPDPVTSSNDDTLTKNSPATKLDKQCKDVESDVAAKSGGKFHLNGTWVECKEIEKPVVAQPAESTATFKYSAAKDREFLSANAYYWLDRWARYLRSLGVTKLNKDMKKVKVDAQAENGKDNSHWHPTSNSITLGEGGVAQDAADMAVVLHEFTHGVCDFLGSQQGGNAGYEHSFCDALPVIYRDRFNPKQVRRTETFPFDNAKGSWSKYRTLNRSEKFDDSNFSSYGSALRQSMLATAFWDCFIGIGGDSPHATTRQSAGDAMIRNLLETILALPDNWSTDVAAAKKIAEETILRDAALTGGLYSKVFYDAYVARGLFAARDVDVFIRDSSGDTGAQPSPSVHWTSPDLWVRNNPPGAGEDPTKGHQTPIVGKANYLYVKVHNRGSKPAKNFKVKAYYCDPGTGMVWPKDFTLMGELAVTGSIAAGGSSTVGPFNWTPKKEGHECLLAVVHGVDDPSVPTTLKGSVPHARLVRFDNNVGQRNVEPKKVVGGGKIATSFSIRGVGSKSRNRLEIDALSLPRDTSIEVRTLRRIVDGATGIEALQVVDTNSVYTTLTMKGGTVAVLDDFELQASDQVGVSLDIDFSVRAVADQIYPIVATQETDDELAGRLTIEILAVKESSDYVYGNPRSHELHTIECPFWPLISQAHKRPFVDVRDGLARGYDGCAYCLPEFHTD